MSKNIQSKHLNQNIEASDAFDCATYRNSNVSRAAYMRNAISCRHKISIPETVSHRNP